MRDVSNIRNFCIIAHIDHGKSTLADRFLEITETVSLRDLKAQTLDSLGLERERGITIKLAPVHMNYELDDVKYVLNLIDTPGHVDFAYEVSRSLFACEGAILVVDATQGIQAQTVSNIYKALDANLKIIPVLNKIDLPASDVDKIAKDLIDTFGFSREEILSVSAKTGEGVAELLREVIKQVPAPIVDVVNYPRGLIFDTYYDDFLGVVANIKVTDGEFSIEKPFIELIATKTDAAIVEVGHFVPKRRKIHKLCAGDVGYIATGLKDISSVKVGDTITQSGVINPQPLPGYKVVQPFVFVSIYPVDNDKFPQLREALEKLSLSDSSLLYEPESNNALGFGFRCGFLGLLHADVVQERLEREYDLDLISTMPSVEYHVVLTTGKKISVKSASELPDRSRIDEIHEPWISLNLVSPSEYVGSIIMLCEERRGVMKKMEYPTEDRVIFEYELPLSELVLNFYDDLKNISSGYASLDYEFLGFREVDAVRLDILVHGEIVEPLSQIVFKDKAEKLGRDFLAKLKDVIPRQQFKVSLQAAIGAKIIARADIAAVRKDVLAKMSGGHRERKDKLLEIQKKGKKRMKLIGKVEIPQEAFRQILRS